MLPGRGYSIIYRAITGNCTLQQFVDSYCTVSNKENMDCGSQDILKRRMKKKKIVLQTQKYFYVFLQGSSSPCVISILVIYSAKHTLSENRLLLEYQLISEFEVCPVFSLKPIFKGSGYLPVSPLPNTDLHSKLLSMFIF